MRKNRYLIVNTVSLLKVNSLKRLRGCLNQSPLRGTFTRCMFIWPSCDRARPHHPVPLSWCCLHCAAINGQWRALTWLLLLPRAGPESLVPGQPLPPHTRPRVDHSKSPISRGAAEVRVIFVFEKKLLEGELVFSHYGLMCLPACLWAAGLRSAMLTEQQLRVQSVRLHWTGTGAVSVQIFFKKYECKLDSLPPGSKFKPSANVESIWGT